MISENNNIRVCQVLHGIVGGGSEQSSPLISIVVPVHNAESTLEKCAASITQQTYKNIEILLINNGSTDNSLGLSQKIASKDERFVVVDFPEKGVSAARNKGIEISKGEYVTFVDADDWIDSNICELFANLNTKYKYDLFCYSAQYHKKNKTTFSHLFDSNVDLFSEEQKEELQIKVFAPQAPRLSYKTETRFIGSACGKFYKRDILLNYNLRFATETIISEDVLFNTLALDHFQRIGYTRECFYHYEQQENSAQTKYRPDSCKYFSFVIAKIQNWLLTTNKNQRFTDAANCLFIHYIFGILKEDIFHKDNPNTIQQKKILLSNILNQNNINDILNKANLKYFSIPELVLYLLLRYKKNWIINQLFKWI